MVSLTQIQYALALKETAHFTKAAKKCHVSQPTLSAQIQKMEELLGVIIFDRSKNPLKLTEIGKELLVQFEKILKEHKNIETIVAESAKVVTGDFHLAIIPTVATYLLPLFLENFSKKFPRVKLKISEYKTDEILNLLEKDKIDGAVLVTPLKNNKVVERHLYFERFYLFAGKGHPLNQPGKVAEKSLTGENLCLLSEGHCFRDQVLNICELKKENSVFKNINFASGNFETLKSLVKKTDMYTLLPELATASLSDKDKKNHLIEFKEPVPVREVSLITGRSYLKEKILEALEEVIIESLPKEINSIKRDSSKIIDL